MLKVAGVRFGRSSFRLLGGAVNSGRSAVVVGELGPRLCTASVVGWFRLRCGVQEVVPLLRCSPPSCSSPPVWTVAVWHTFGCHHVRTAPRCWTKCLLLAEVVKEVVKSQSVVEQSVDVYCSFFKVQNQSDFHVGNKGLKPTWFRAKTTTVHKPVDNIDQNKS